jgi:hypothetical protein
MSPLLGKIMIKNSYIGTGALVSCLLGFGAIGHAQDLAITHAVVYAAPDAPVRQGVTVLIRHGVIAAVGEHVPIPKGIETISCEGCFVFAGFWNAHVHFMEPKWERRRDAVRREIDSPDERHGQPLGLFDRGGLRIGR